MINHRVKHLLFVGIALTVCVLLLSLAGCASSFEGNSIKNADSYALDIETMNGTDSHTLELERGDTLQIQFESEKGSLYMEITAPDGTAIYQGDGTEATQFTLDVPADGAYTISVEGKKAQGSIYVDVEKAPEFTSEELVGPWHLDQSKNDLASFADSLDLFPGYGEWGASMEIRGNGEMSWYIGAEGWHGTYTLEDGLLHAQLTSTLEQSTQLWDFRITEENGVAELEMDYQDMTIYWVYGDRGDTANGTDNT